MQDCHAAENEPCPWRPWLRPRKNAAMPFDMGQTKLTIPPAGKAKRMLHWTNIISWRRGHPVAGMVRLVQGSLAILEVERGSIGLHRGANSSFRADIQSSPLAIGAADGRGQKYFECEYAGLQGVGCRAI
jgi:hypothetical protein